MALPIFLSFKVHTMFYIFNLPWFSKHKLVIRCFLLSLLLSLCPASAKLAKLSFLIMRRRNFNRPILIPIIRILLASIFLKTSSFLTCSVNDILNNILLNQYLRIIIRDSVMFSETANSYRCPSLTKSQDHKYVFSRLCHSLEKN